MTRERRIVVLGLSITSSWGNGHATTYRSLLRGLCQLGQHVTFLERDQPWYAENRDFQGIGGLRVSLYRDLAELQARHAAEVRDADCVIVGSYVPDGVEIGQWVTRTARGCTAFYDIDTPITLAQLSGKEPLYICRALVPRFDLYLSFTGGPTLDLLERKFGAQRARALYCAADPQIYFPQPQRVRWDLAYMGTYSLDRQPTLDNLLLSVARERTHGRFAVVGPQYPENLSWPDNVQRITHLAPDQHRQFYNGQRFTLNVTRAEMRRSGYSPSVRLFEAAASGTPIISDTWPGLECFFDPGQELLVAHGPAEVAEFLYEMPEDERRAIALRARARVMSAHTGVQRARELLGHLDEVGCDTTQGKAGQAR